MVIYEDGHLTQRQSMYELVTWAQEDNLSQLDGLSWAFHVGCAKRIRWSTIGRESERG